MPSFVWDRDLQEAYSMPYEYAGQEQFAREAANILDRLSEHYAQRNQSYTRDDTSVAKAVWMLQVDSLEALRDALLLTNEKKHRIAMRLFRDALETQDTSYYFACGGAAAEKDRREWYRDQVIPHRVARDFIKSCHGTKEFEDLRSLYGGLSKYTHRTYRALAMSYILARDDLFVYDGFRKDGTSLVVPHVISLSYAALAMLTRRFLEVAVLSAQLTRQRADKIWSDSLESESIPRRFAAVAIPLDLKEGTEQG